MPRPMKILSSLIVGALCSVGLLQLAPYLLILLAQIPLTLLPVLSGRFVKVALVVYLVIVFFGGWIATSVYAAYRAPNVATIWLRGCLIGTIIWFVYAFLNLYASPQNLTDPFLVAVALLVTAVIARQRAALHKAGPRPPEVSEQGTEP